MSEWVSVIKQIMIHNTSQKNVSSLDVFEDRNFAYSTIEIAFDHTLLVRLDVKTCHCYKILSFSDLTDWLDGCYFRMFWRNLWTLSCSEVHSERQSVTHRRGFASSVSPRWQTAVTHVTAMLKGPHTMIVTFVVRWLWGNRNGGLGRVFVSSQWLPFVALYCATVRDKEIGWCLVLNCT